MVFVFLAYFTLYNGLHETSARTWCPGKTQRDRVEREVGGGIGMGNTCKPMGDSFQCMTKPTTIKKKKKSPTEGQEPPPSLDENGPGGVISLTVPVCLQVPSYFAVKECLYVGRCRNSWWSYPEWKKGETEGIWSWQGQPATVIDSCVSFWKAGCELHSPLYTQNTQHAALYLGGAYLLLINEAN